MAHNSRCGHSFLCIFEKPSTGPAPDTEEEA
jgi:hypothetical protein